VAKIYAPQGRRYVNPFSNMGNNYQQPESPVVGSDYDYGPSFEDVRLNRRFDLLADSGLSLFGGDMDALTDLVMGESTDAEMLDTYLISRDAEAMQGAKSYFESLQPVEQEQEFYALPPYAQERLREQGYKLPGESGPGFAWGLGGIPYVGDAAKGLTKVAVKGLGMAGRALMLDKAWYALAASGRLGARVGRTVDFSAEAGTMWSMNPADLITAWRAVEHSQTSFDQASMDQVRNMGFDDREIELIRQLAGFGTDGIWTHLAKEAALAGREGDTEYTRQLFDSLGPWMNSDKVVEAQSILDAGRVDTFEYSRKYYNKHNLFFPDVRRGTKPATVMGVVGSLTTEIFYDPLTWVGGIWTRGVKGTRAGMTALTRPRMTDKVGDLVGAYMNPNTAYMPASGLRQKTPFRLVEPQHLNPAKWSKVESAWNKGTFWRDLTDVMRAAGPEGISAKEAFAAERMRGWLETGKNADIFFAGLKPTILLRGRQLIRFMDELADNFTQYDDLYAKANNIFIEASNKGDVISRDVAMEMAERLMKKADPTWVRPETYLLTKYPGMDPIYSQLMGYHKQKRWTSYQFIPPAYGPVDLVEEGITFAETVRASHPGLTTSDGIWEFMFSEAGTQALSTGWGGRGASNALLLPTGLVGKQLGKIRHQIDKTIDFGAKKFPSGLNGSMSQIAMEWVVKQNKFVSTQIAKRMLLEAGDPARLSLSSGVVLDAESIKILLRNPTDTATLGELGVKSSDDVKELLDLAENLRLDYIKEAAKDSDFDELFNFYAESGMNLRDEDVITGIVREGANREVLSRSWFRVYNNYLDEANHIPGSRNAELLRGYEAGGLGVGIRAKALAVQLMYHPAKLAKKLTTYVPTNSAIDVLDDKTALKEFEALIEMGVLADMPRDVIENFKQVFIHGTEAQRWNVQVEFLMDFVARSGALVHGGPKIEDFMRRFISKADHVYDILRQDGVDLFKGFTVTRAKTPALAHGAQLSQMNIIPNYRELAGVARYMGFMRNMGWGLHLPTIDKMFSRVWRPSVLLRIGYIPRNGGDELLSYLLREGPKPYIRGRLARIMTGRVALWDKYGRKVYAYKGKKIDAKDYADLLIAQDMKTLVGVDAKNISAVHHNMLMGALTAPLRWASELAGVGDVAVTRKTFTRIMADNEMKRTFQFMDYDKQLEVFNTQRKIVRGEATGTIRGTVFYRPFALGQWAAARTSEVMWEMGQTAGLWNKKEWAEKTWGRLDSPDAVEQYNEAMDILLSHPSIRDSFLRDLFNTYDPYMNSQHSLDEAMRAGGYGRAVHARYRLPMNYSGSKFEWVGRGGTEGSPDWWNGLSTQLIHKSGSEADVLYARELLHHVAPEFEKQNKLILDAVMELGSGSTTLLYDAADPMGATRAVAQAGRRLDDTQRDALNKIYAMTGEFIGEESAPNVLHRLVREAAEDPDDTTNLVNFFLKTLKDNPDIELWRALMDPDYLSLAATTAGVGFTSKGVGSLWPRVMTFILNNPEPGKLVDSLEVATQRGLDKATRYYHSGPGQQILQSVVSTEMGGARIAGQTMMGPHPPGTARVWTPTLPEPAMRVLASYLNNPTTEAHGVFMRTLLKHLPAGTKDPQGVAFEVMALLNPASSPYRERTVGSLEYMIQSATGIDHSHIPLLTASTDPHVAHAIGKALNEALQEIGPVPDKWGPSKLQVRDLSSDAFFNKPGLNLAETEGTLGSSPRVTANGVVSTSGGMPDPVGGRLFYAADRDGTIVMPESIGGFENKSVFAVAQEELVHGAQPVRIVDGEPQVLAQKIYKRVNPETGEVENIWVRDGGEHVQADFDPETWKVEKRYFTALNDQDFMAQKFATENGDSLMELVIGHTDDREVLHEVLYEILNGDRVDIKRLMANGDKNVMPKRMFAEIPVSWADLAPSERAGHRWNRVLAAWFDGQIHPAMEAMVREPMFAGYFGDSWQLYRGTEALYLKNLKNDLPGLTRAFTWSDANGGHVIQELEDLVVHVWPNKSIDPSNGFARLATAFEERNAEAAKQLIGELLPDLAKKIPDNAWDDLVSYANIRNNAHQARTSHSLEKAGAVTSGFIDDHRIRSQFQEMVGTLLPFWFAEDLYLRRWVRSLNQNPLALRNLQLTIRGGERAGFIQEDGQGRKYVVLPESPITNEMLVETVSTVPLMGKYLAGVGGLVAGGQTFRLDKLMPGYDLDTVGRPQVGPFLSYPMSLLTIADPTLFHDISPFMQEKYSYVSDKVQNNRVHDVLDAFFPYPISQAMTISGVLPHWNRDEQFASAQIAAVKLRAATGRMPAQDQIADKDNPEVFSEEFMEQLDHEAWAIMGMRFFTWFVGTGQGTLEDLRFGDAWDWNAEFHWYVQKGWTYDEALLKFYESHEGDENFDKDDWATQQKINLFRTGTTVKTGLGYTQQSEAVDLWLTGNEDFALANRHITGFLVPYEVDLEYDEDMAWGWKQRQIAYGLRQLKSRDEYITDFYFNGAASEFYDRRQRYHLATATLRSQGQTTAAQELDDRMGIWEDAFMARHPVFASEMARGNSKNRRDGAIGEMKRALANPQFVPDTPYRAEILDVFSDIVRMDHELMLISNVQGVADYRSFVKAFFLRRIEAKVAGKPHLQAMLNNLVIPYLDENWVAEYRAGLIQITPKKLVGTF
jgi:hypothetical protein